MSKKQSPAPADELNNFEDIGYSQAGANATIEARARDAMRLSPGFADEVSDEVKAALYTGYTKRYGELSPEKTYAAIDGNYVEATGEMLTSPKVERVIISAALVSAYSTHEIAQMEKTHNARYKEIVVEYRGKLKTYCSNRLRDLQRKAKELSKDPDTRKTRESKTFEKVITDAFESWDKSVKTRSKNGDETASVARFELAKSAFWKAYRT